MRIFLDSDYASFQAVVGALAPIAGVKAVFYGVKPGSSPATVQSAQVLFSDNNQYVDLNLGGNPGNQPAETTFLTDFPSAIVATINTLSY